MIERINQLHERRARIDAEINHTRTLAERLRELERAIERSEGVAEAVERVRTEFERFATETTEAGPIDSDRAERSVSKTSDDETRQQALSYLVDEEVWRAVLATPNLAERGEELRALGDLGSGRRTLLEAAVVTVERFVRAERPTLEERWHEPLALLGAYAAGGKADRDDVLGAFESVFDPKRRDESSVAALEAHALTFELVTRACVGARDRYDELIAEALEDVYRERDPVSRLGPEPSLLLPVRLETRFVDPDDPHELRIRVYPDQIHADSHESELTEAEVVAGKRFWATLALGLAGAAATSAKGSGSFVEPEVQTFADDVDLEAYERAVADGDDVDVAARYDELKSKGWNRLIERFDPERAAYIVEAVTPVEIDESGTPVEPIADRLLTRPDSDEKPFGTDRITFESVDRKGESWTKRATARLLPDRWIAILEWDAGADTERKLVTGNVVPPGLAIDPAVEPGSAGDEMDWLFDYDRAVEDGMAITVPLEELDGFNPATDAIDSLLVLGMRTTADATQTAADVRSVFDAHRFTDGLALLESGTPTNLESAPDPAVPDPPEPAGRQVADAERTTDATLLAGALGLVDPVDGFHPFERVPNADSTRFEDAKHVNNVLWSATLGYYLRHLAVPNELATGVDPVDGVEPLPTLDVEDTAAWLEGVDAARNHFTEYVRGGGPFPTVQVAEIPYGVLPVARLDEKRAWFGGDGRLADRIAAYVRSLRPLWDEAIADEPLSHPADTVGASPLDPAHEDWDVLDVLERSGVSHGATSGARFTNWNEHVRTWENELLSWGYVGQVLAANEAFEDGRSAVEASIPSEMRELLYDARATTFDREDIEDEVTTPAHEFVDPDFDRFVEILQHESFDRLQTLSSQVDLGAKRHGLLVEDVFEWAGVDLEGLDPELEDEDEKADEEWRAERRALLETVWEDELSPGIRHALLLRAIEARGGNRLSHDLTRFFDPNAASTLLETIYHPRLVTANAFARRYDDAGTMNSLVRVLTHYATLQEYADGRLRLGLQVDDPPASDPDRIPGHGSTRSDLYDYVPDVAGTVADPDNVEYAPLIDSLIAGEDPDNVLPDGLTAPQTTVDFAESLEHVGGLDRSSTASLTADALDTTSHRLDAWWTSLATAAVFAHRRIDPNDFHPHEAGLHVGAYGYVEELRPDAQVEDRLTPAFVHTPSADLANTAALLRSGYDAAEDDELREALAMDLSAERVRDAKWLLDGVRRGTALGELLGARFERRMHEVTMDSLAELDEGDGNVCNLMRWKHSLRERYPAVSDQLETADEASGPDESGSDVAHSDVLDGYELLREFQAGELELVSLSIPDQDDGPDEDEIDAFDALLAELDDDLDAVSDLLVAETAHQIARGDPEKGGASLEGLERAEGVPDPDVVEVPRSETGVTHRHLLLFDPEAADEGKTPRAHAEPVLESWVDSLLPAHDEVECVVAWEQTGQTDEDGGDDEVVLESGTVAVELASLGLSNLDLLALSGDHRQGRSELDARMRHHVVRAEPVPADAELSIQYRDVDDDGKLDVATVLEVARSLSALLDETRPATGEDLTHPSESTSTGYSAATADTLWGRYDDLGGTDGLKEIRGELGSAMALLAPEDEDDDQDEADEPATSVPERIDEVEAAARAATETIPFDDLEAVLEAIDEDELSGAMFALSPPGDRENVLLEAPGTFTETVSLDPESMTEKTVVYDVGERDPAIEGEPIETKDLPPDISGSSSSSDAVRTAYERLAEARSILLEVATALERPALLESYEEPATTLRSSRAHYERALETYELAWRAHEEGAHDRAKEAAKRTIDLAERVVHLAKETNDLATLDDELIYVDDVPGAGGFEEQPTVTVWGTDGEAWFEDDGFDDPTIVDGTLEVSVDLSVEPGTWVTVTVRDGDRLVYHRSGYVGAPEPELDDAIARLAWLAWAREEVRVALESVEAAVSAVPSWVAVETTLEDASDVDSPSLTDERLEQASAALLGSDERAGLADTDPVSVLAALDAVLAPWDAAALADLVTVSRASAGPAEASYSSEPARPTFAVESSLELDHLDVDLEADAIATALEAIVTLSGDSIGEVQRAANGWEPDGYDETVPMSTTQRRLTKWLYHPDESDDGEAVAVATALSHQVARIDETGSDGAAAFDERLSAALPAETDLETVAAVLGSLATALFDGSTSGNGGVGGDVQLGETTGAAITADVLDALFDVLTAVEDEPTPAETFRLAVLELVRDALWEAGWFSVYGAIPASPVGHTHEDERALAAQAGSVLSKLEDRIDAVESILRPDEDAPPEERVDAATDRLETLFDGSVPVLPPFTPTNAAELEATFTDDPGALAENPLAVETWFQRAAQVTERLADEREVLSYVAALSDGPVREFGVGQLPYTPDDEWVGLDDVEPVDGAVSIVAAFGVGSGPDGFTSADGEPSVAGVFVDEWVEGVAAEHQDTGLALRYDAPGSRAPGSMLLAMPPGPEGWTIESLIETVEETMTYTKLRAVDAHDLEARTDDLPWPLLPAPYYAERLDTAPNEPVMEPERVTYHSPLTREACRLHVMDRAKERGVSDR
ncbi:hypothetical protein [Natronoglomus mannanivorans]|uniref:Uncharacterized protein n=1 Tax=Natronoglomus mannanivorans TaxID=2979990 RepID=A0AAP3E281_9EURY|nr:hypothetical protein [Halobacteria archaeon AArc-xg1-1]